MHALQRKILIDSMLIYPATAIIAGSVTGLLSRRGAGIAAAVACIPVLILAVIGSDSWLQALIQLVAYGWIAWVAGALACKWRGRKVHSTL